MNKKYRKKLFLHLDGIVIIPIINSFLNKGILDYIYKHEKNNITDLKTHFQINEGYGNITLRLLKSIGIIKNRNQKNKNLILQIINLKNTIYKISNLYKYYINLEKIFNDKSKNENFIKLLQDTHKELSYKKKNIQKELYYYLEGAFLGPLLSNLGFLQIIKENQIQHKKICNKKTYLIINNILSENGFLNEKNEYTDKGNFFFNRLASYGVTVSYLNTFAKIDDLLFNENYFMWERDENGHEIHVNRTMNVWGSGGAHKFYFKKIDEIIIDIFNQEIDKQPKGIIDVGCGDGSFLIHLYNIIMTKTSRKKHIKDFPLKVIGVDLNKAARTETEKNLKINKIDHIVIDGNISEPSTINQILNEKFNENLNDYLNTRTFLDHNRIYSKSKKDYKSNIKTTGAFSYKGELITSNEIVNNLIEHFKNWKPFISKYGIIILELHTLNPKLISENRGKTLSCAYDATHGFSDQYLIEYDTFLKCLEFANFKLKNKKTLFPNKNIPTISINYLK
tara:strand:- start:8417 stop:9940 length:1524 start_codon:yes stop_codon:yes gene_type:complete